MPSQLFPLAQYEPFHFERKKSTRQIGKMCVRRRREWEMKINSETPSNFYRMDSGIRICFLWNSILILSADGRTKANKTKTKHAWADAFQQWVNGHTRPFNLKLKQILFLRDVGENRATCTWFTLPDKFYLLGNVLRTQNILAKPEKSKKPSPTFLVQCATCSKIALRPKTLIQLFIKFDCLKSKNTIRRMRHGGSSVMDMREKNEIIFSSSSFAFSTLDAI